MGYASDVMSAWDAIANGVTAQTTTDRQKYWKHWCDYCRHIRVRPDLKQVSILQTIIATTAFGARVRSGHYGNGKTVTVQTVSKALAAISKTMELAGATSPLYKTPNVFHLPIQRLLEGLRRVDPPAVPQLAIPATVPHTCFHKHKNSSNSTHRRTADLCIVAFYYLLRVGEYTPPRFIKRGTQIRRATRTVQFTIGCIGFFKNGKLIPRTSDLQTLLTADSATLRIINQKNGRMGTCIHHECSSKDTSPVKALARIVASTLAHGGNDDTLICDHWDPDTHTWKSVQSRHIIAMIRQTVTDLNLHLQGIDPDLVGAHSLRAGGAMALKLHGFDDTTIMKMGRWTSLTFLMYIHNQIAHLGKDISKKMSEELPFVNIACIDIRDEPPSPITD